MPKFWLEIVLKAFLCIFFNFQEKVCLSVEYMNSPSERLLNQQWYFALFDCLIYNEHASSLFIFPAGFLTKHCITHVCQPTTTSTVLIWCFTISLLKHWMRLMWMHWSSIEENFANCLKNRSVTWICVMT